MLARTNVLEGGRRRKLTVFQPARSARVSPLTSAEALRGRIPGRRRLLCVRACRGRRARNPRQQDRDATPGTAGRPRSPEPRVQPARDGGVPPVAGQRPPCGAGSSARGPTPAGYCGIVQMGPQADAPCLGRGHLLPMNALTEMCGVTKRHEGAGRPAVDGASLTARRTSEGDQMRDSIHPARLTRSRRAHLLAVAVLLSVVLAAGCGGGPGSTATTVPTGPAPSGAVSGCLLHPGSCYAPHLFRVAYGIQPLLDKGIDGRGETVTVLAPAPPPAPRQALPLAATSPRPPPISARTWRRSTACSGCPPRGSRS